MQSVKGPALSPVVAVCVKNATNFATQSAATWGAKWVGVVREQRWRRCGRSTWAAEPGAPQSSQGVWWWPPPAPLSEGSYSPSWSRCKWSRWKGRSSGRPGVWCSSCCVSLDPAKSPTVPERPGCSAPSAVVLTGWQGLRRQEELPVQGLGAIR